MRGSILLPACARISGLNLRLKHVTDPIRAGPDATRASVWLAGPQEFVLWYLTEVAAFVPLRAAICMRYGG